jgi:broad specificity phosphatase PhoE
MITLVFETHATTLDNEAGIATGWLEGELSDQGRREAVHIGPRRRAADEAIASDLGRARQTAQLAFAGRSVPVRYDHRLRECNYGKLNGAPVDQIAGERRGRIRRPFPGGESYQDVCQRVACLLEEVARGPDGRTVIVIGHSATRWAIEHLLLGTPLEALVDAPFDWKPGWVFALPKGWQPGEGGPGAV